MKKIQILFTAALTMASSSLIATETLTTMPSLEPVQTQLPKELHTDIQTFPVEPVATELTEAEKKEASELRHQSAELYSSVLTYNSHAREKTVTLNLEFIDKSIVKAEKRLKAEVTNYKALSQDIYNKGKRIKAMNVSDTHKNKRLIELQDMYEQHKDSMLYQISMLKDRIKTLKSRREIYAEDKIDLAQINKESKQNAPLNWKEKDEKRQKQALNTLDQLEQDLINKEFDKLLK